MKVRIFCASYWNDLPSEYIEKINKKYNFIQVKEKYYKEYVKYNYVKVKKQEFKDLILFMFNEFGRIVIEKESYCGCARNIIIYDDYLE